MRAIVPPIAIIHRFLLAAVCACGFGLLLCRPSFAAAPTPGAANTVASATNTALNLTGTGSTSEADIPWNGTAPAAKAAGEDHSAGALAIQLLNTLLVLALLLMGAYLVMLALKKYYYGGRRPLAAAPGAAHPGRAIQVLESAAMGPGRSLHLVAVGGRCFLVGATAQQMTMLGEVTDDRDVQSLLTSRRNGDTVLPFQQMLSRLLPTPPSPEAGGKEPRA